MIAWKNNPEGCVRPSRLAEYDGDCNACYLSQVNDSNVWTGPQKCFGASCLVLDRERSDQLWKGDG